VGLFAESFGQTGRWIKPGGCVKNWRLSVKVGDLVKIKWITFASMRRAKRMGRPVDKAGLVVEESCNVAKVVFPSTGGKIFTFVKSNLEVVNESR
jgi:hypothetical protein